MPPTCSTTVIYLDDPSGEDNNGKSKTQLRICRDKDNEIFVYVRCDGSE